MFLPFLFGVLLQVPRQIAVRSERVLRVDGDANLSVVDSKYVDKIAVNVLVQRVHDTTVDSPKFSAEIDLSFHPVQPLAGRSGDGNGNGWINHEVGGGRVSRGCVFFRIDFECVTKPSQSREPRLRFGEAR